MGRQSVPYWKMGFRGGLLSGRNRGESVTKFRRDALQTDEDRELWDREEAERLGVPRFLRPFEDRIGELEKNLDAQRRSGRGRHRGGMTIPEDID